MKKIIKLIKNNIKLIIGIAIGIVIPIASAYAATIYYQGNNVGYDNSKTGFKDSNGNNVEDVQTALDELYTKASKWLNPNDMGTPQYYAFGQYKGWCNNTNTNCNSYADFPTIATTPPSGKNVYAVKYEDGQYGVCIQRNGTEHCFRARNYKAEAKHVQEVFSDINCRMYSYSVSCSEPGFECWVSPDGGVGCDDSIYEESCSVGSSGLVFCS